MKKTWLVLIIVLLGIAVAGACFFLDSIFPMAESISCPDVEHVDEIRLVGDGGDFVVVDGTEHEKILECIADAKPTRAMSVNDYPAVEIYYAVEVDSADGRYRYFLFVENSQACIEIPYEGVYKTNQQFFDLVAGYFEK